MRKLFLLPVILLSGLLIGNNSQATIVKPRTVLPAIFNDLRLKDFLALTPKQISEISGKPMTLAQKISYKLLRGSMKKAVKKDPAITTGQFFSSSKKMKTWLLILIIVAGALLLALFIFGLAYAGRI